MEALNRETLIFLGIAVLLINIIVAAILRRRLRVLNAIVATAACVIVIAGIAQYTLTPAAAQPNRFAGGRSGNFVGAGPNTGGATGGSTGSSTGDATESAAGANTSGAANGNTGGGGGNGGGGGGLSRLPPAMQTSIAQGTIPAPLQTRIAAGGGGGFGGGGRRQPGASGTADANATPQANGTPSAPTGNATENAAGANTSGAANGAANGGTNGGGGGGFGGGNGGGGGLSRLPPAMQTSIAQGTIPAPMQTRIAAGGGGFGGGGRRQPGANGTADANATPQANGTPAAPAGSAAGNGGTGTGNGTGNGTGRNQNANGSNNAGAGTGANNAAGNAAAPSQLTILLALARRYVPVLTIAGGLLVLFSGMIFYSSERQRETFRRLGSLGLLHILIGGLIIAAMLAIPAVASQASGSGRAAAAAVTPTNGPAPTRANIASATPTEMPPPANTATPLPTLTPVPTETPVVLSTPVQYTVNESSTAVTNCSVSALQGLNLRAEPATNQMAMGKVIAGALMKVTGKSADGKWWQVISPDNVQGWVSADFVTPYSGCSSSSVPVVNVAKR